MKSKTTSAPGSKIARKLRAAGLLGLALLFPLLCGAETVSQQEEIPVIAGPLRVDLADGRSHTGQPVSFRNDILVLRTRLDGGEVDRGFPRDQVVNLHFAGDEFVAEALEWREAGELGKALPILEALWRQRAPFLVLLPAETIDLLATLAAAHLEAGDPYRAIALARNLLSHTSSGETADSLHEVVLLGHYRLGFYEETEELARAWINQQADFPDSALGWRILADLALREEDWDRVRWRALQPIAMAGPEAMAHLDHCYALAIHAFHQEDDQAGAARLYREMMDRRLSWPDLDTLAATGEIYETRAAREAKRRAAAAGPDLDLRPPEDDLNLPIQEVRRLLQATHL